MSGRFDYTTARKGARTPRGKIVICPRCGRKGAYRRLARPMGRVVAEVVHGGRYDSGFTVTDDWHPLTSEEDATVTP